MGKLGKYVNIRTGKLNANASVSGGEYPFFTCAVKSLRINKFAFDCECVLVAGNGDLNVKYYKGKFNAYQRTYIIECKDRNMLNTKYLKLYLDKALDKLRLNTKGGVIQYIRLSDLTNLEIILPSIIYQKQIAKVLSDCEILIKKRKESICLLDELIRSTFLEMFGDPVKNEKGWDVDSINSVIQDITSGVSYGGDEKRELDTGEFGVLKISAVTSGSLNPKEFKAVKKDTIKKSIITLKKGMFLISRANTRDLIAACCIVPRDYPKLFIPDKLWSLNIDEEKINLIFLNNLFKNESYRNLIRKMASGGHSSMLNISMKKFRTLKIPLPPFKIQNNFEDQIKKIEYIRESFLQSLKQLENLYGSISQQAFKGELDLSKVDILDMEEMIKDTDSVIEPIGEERQVGKVIIQDCKNFWNKMIKQNFDDKLFSVQDIQDFINDQGLSVDDTKIKDSLRIALSENIIEQIFNDALNQIMFRLKK